MVLVYAGATLVFALIALFWLIHKIRQMEEREADIGAGAASESAPFQIIRQLEEKLNVFESRISGFTNIFSQWQSEKEKLAEKLAFSGLNQEVSRYNRQVEHLLKSLGDLTADSSGIKNSYSDLKKMVEDALESQLSVLPAKLQPLIAEYKEVNESIAVSRENLIARLKQKDEAIRQLLQRHQQLTRQKEAESAEENEEIRILKGQLRDSLKKSAAGIQEYLNIVKQQNEYFDREIEVLKTNKESVISSLQSRRGDARAHINNARLELNRELELLKQELHASKASGEEALNKKEEEIMALNAQVLELQNQIQDKKDIFNNMVEKFKKKVGYKQTQAEARKKELSLQQNLVMKTKKEEFDRLKEEVVSAEENLKNDVEKELSLYAEEEKNLINARDEYERQLKNEKADFEKKLLNYESELSDLKRNILEAEQKWEKESAAKKKDFEYEKDILFGKLKKIREDIEQEQLGRQELIESMHREFKAINEESAQNLRQIKIRFKNSEEEFAVKRDALLQQIAEATKMLELERVNMDESEAARLEELNSIKRSYVGLCQKNDDERSQLDARVSRQRTGLEAELKELEKSLSDEITLTENEKKSRSHELEKLVIENEQKQKDANMALLRKQKEHESAIDELKSEISRVQKEMAKKKELYEKTMHQMDDEIRKLAKNMGLKESELKEIRNRTDIILKKSSKPVLKSIDSIKAKISDYKQKAAQDLRTKDEEIQTLKIRLALRDEMLENNIRKKEENLSKINQRLKIYLDQLQQHARKQSQDEDKILRPLHVKAQHLKMQQQQLTEKIQKERENQNVLASRLERIEKEMKVLEKEPAADFSHIERLAKLREKEIGMLNRELVRKEESMNEWESFMGSVINENFQNAEKMQKQISINPEGENTK